MPPGFGLHPKLVASANGRSLVQGTRSHWSHKRLEKNSLAKVSLVSTSEKFRFLEPVSSADKPASRHQPSRTRWDTLSAQRASKSSWS